MASKGAFTYIENFVFVWLGYGWFLLKGHLMFYPINFIDLIHLADDIKCE